MTDTAPAVRGTTNPPAELATAEDALHWLARANAVVTWFKDQDTEVRAWLHRRLESEGGDKRVDDDSLGSALITNPRKKPVVPDRKALEDWARRHQPDEVVERVDVNASTINGWLNHPDPDERATRLTALADLVGCEPESVATTDVLLPEKLPETLMKQGKWTEDGEVIDTTTGELLPVRVEDASEPKLKVTFSPSGKSALLAELGDSVIPPQLAALPGQVEDDASEA